MKIDQLRLIGLGGSNKVMQGELSRLLRRALDGERSRALLETPPRKVGPGGLAYPFHSDLAAVAVTYHRTSARVLWDLYQSDADRLEPLYEELFSDVIQDSRPWLKDGLGLSVLAFGTGSVRAGERQVVGVVKNALIDGAAHKGISLRLEPERPDLLVHVRANPVGREALSEDSEPSSEPSGPTSLTVSLDLAGRPMHQRGYRTAAGLAPLREDLAANLVMLARHNARSQVVIDPLAGSGTLLIEAALMGAGRPLWMSGRSPLAATMGGLEEQVALQNGALFDDTRCGLYGAELDEDAFASLEKNAQTAGVHGQLTAFPGDFRQWDLARGLSGETEQTGLILSNPPYGSRLDLTERELGSLYRDLGEWCWQFRGFTAAFLVGEATEADSRRESSVALFLRSFGGKPRVKKPMSNGPLRAQFLLYDL